MWERENDEGLSGDKWREENTHDKTQTTTTETQNSNSARRCPTWPLTLLQENRPGWMCLTAVAYLAHNDWSRQRTRYMYHLQRRHDHAEAMSPLLGGLLARLNSPDDRPAGV